MKKLFWVLLILDLVVVNGGMAFFLYKSQITNNKSQTNSDTQIPIIQNQAVDTCGAECRKYIEDKVNSLAVSLMVTPAPAPTGETVIINKTAPRQKTRTVSYVTIPGNGSSTANDWQDLTGTDFYFDKADYPGLVSVYFEANMKLFNGNGMAYVRLFDVTHGIGVQGSETNTNSQTDSLLSSGQMTFWAGKNLIRVQAKTLTADTTIYNYGRLKITIEN